MSCPSKEWVALACAAAVAGCSPTPPPDKPQPLGELPSAVTSAQPLWVPFRVRAGQPVSVDPRSPLSDVRQLTLDGHAGAARFEPSGEAILYETGDGSGSCGKLIRVDLQTDERTTLTPAGLPPNSAALASPALARQARLLALTAAATAPACSLWGERSGQTLWLGASSIIALPYPHEGASAGRYSISGSGHNGAATLSPGGRSAVFASTRDGDPELYITQLGLSGQHGSSAGAGGAGATATAAPAVQRLTNSPGYDGHPQLSPDGTSLVWQREQVSGEEPLAALATELASGRRTPTKLVVMLSGPRGQNARVIAAFGHHSAMPTFDADSRHVLFSSDRDHQGAGPPNYDIYRLDPDGPLTSAGHPRLQRLTFDEAYDGAPAISPDGKLLLFTSSRNAQSGETNIIIARLDRQ